MTKSTHLVILVVKEAAGAQTKIHPTVLTVLERGERRERAVRM